MKKIILLIMILCCYSLSYPIVSLAAPPSNDELADFVDSFFREKMEEYHVPGAVVTIVEGGNIRVLNGYGYADLKERKAVDPKQTVFRLGSIAKVFTTTAVMQLAESGKVDLYKDIKKYDPTLNIQYIDGHPITLHHLLTHTAGFYEKITVGRDKEQQLPLADAIHQYLADVVRPPGQEISYSNQGMSLAGYLVEKVSGEKFEQYMKEHVFNPLDMGSSGYSPDEETDRLAKSYNYGHDKKYIPVSYAYIHHLPAGSFQSTAEDMSHFMIAQLQKGRFNNQQLFSEETATEMQNRHFTPNKDVPGIAYGFYERFQNGLRIIEHDGSIDAFNSIMHLIPAENTGIFISTNSNTGVQLAEEFIRDYLNRFYPEGQKKPVLRENPTSASKLKSLEGYYVPNGPMVEGPFRFAQNFSTSKLAVKRDGVITISSSGKSTTYVETKPYLFQEKKGSELIYLNKDHHTYSASSTPIMLYRQMPGYSNPIVNVILMVGFILVYPIQILTALIIQVFSFIRKRKKAFPWVITFASVLFILYFMFVISIPELLINAIPTWSYILIYLPVITLTLLVAFTIWQLRRKKTIGRGQYAFVAVTAIFTLYMYAWDFFKI
ncbi:serine hydrolase domain-containing protein [Bacillus sp. S14(2024)]|uniref:serine hydrolase domain-containing protein n=1 Tax=Bacillus sp. S14(2024) TaxID=3162884 RepID=UPI003D19E780